MHQKRHLSAIPGTLQSNSRESGVHLAHSMISRIVVLRTKSRFRFTPPDQNSASPTRDNTTCGVHCADDTPQ